MFPDYTSKDVERFWSKVDKRGPDECWIWIGGRRSGYGSFWLNKRHENSHRFAYLISVGDPMNFDVCHSCDNPLCCNPTHLWLGTHQDNMNDRDRKGRNVSSFGIRNGSYTHPESRPRGEFHGSRTRPDRMPRGELHGMSVLSALEVDEIRSQIASGVKQNDIAKSFLVSQSTISLIKLGKIWRSK